MNKKIRETILCPVCGGSGRVQDLSRSTNAWVACCGCWGKGWIEVPSWLQEEEKTSGVVEILDKKSEEVREALENLRNILREGFAGLEKKIEVVFWELGNKVKEVFDEILSLEEVKLEEMKKMEEETHHSKEVEGCP
jgi:hypothetical protein